MHWIDWSIVVVCVTLLGIFSLYTTRHVKVVADFLAASRSGGRYLITIASQIAAIGAVSGVAQFEMYYAVGFVPIWWQLMSIPVWVIIVMSSYVCYRFRETRAMTMAQFYEMRYSKASRVYAGIITWVSGLVNFGIFPIVEALFIVYFCGLPPTITALGWTISTVAPVMLLTLATSLLFASMGGQITVMATDCAQGIFCGFAYLFIAVFLMVKIPWSDLVQGLSMSPAGASVLNPYDTAGFRDFNVWFFLVGIFGMVYGYMSWQGSAGYQSSALNPHEQKMSAIIGGWRTLVQSLMIVLIAVSAYAFLHLPKYATSAAEVQSVIQTIPTETLQKQMRVPIALAHMLPAGLKGLFATIMLFFLITTQDTYMHSWGSMLIQDVVLPFRKKAVHPQDPVGLAAAIHR